MNDRRWIYALGGLVAILAIALVVVLVARDDDSNGASDTTTTTLVTTTTAPATTAPAPTTTARAPTTVSLPPLTNDTQSYAMYLFAAWQNDNRSAAAQVASAEAVGQMFSQAYSAQNPYTFGACNPAAGSVYCTWTAPNGPTITMTVRNITGGLPIQVVVVTRS